MDWKRGGIKLRELAGFVLLMILLLAGLLLSWQQGTQNARLAESLDDCVWLVLSGQWENGRKQAEAAKKQWEQSRTSRAVVGNHGPAERVDELFAELTVCGAAGDRTGYARLCAVLSAQLKAIGDAGKLSWQNVL